MIYNTYGVVGSSNRSVQSLVKELRDQAARETLGTDDPFGARKLRAEWRAADELERLTSGSIQVIVSCPHKRVGSVTSPTTGYPPPYLWCLDCNANLGPVEDHPAPLLPQYVAEK